MQCITPTPDYMIEKRGMGIVPLATGAADGFSYACPGPYLSPSARVAY